MIPGLTRAQVVGATKMSDLIGEIARIEGLAPELVRAVLNQHYALITLSLHQRIAVTIPNFGLYEPRFRSARLMPTPTGSTVLAPDRWSAGMRPSDGLKIRLNEPEPPLPRRITSNWHPAWTPPAGPEPPTVQVPEPFPAPASVGRTQTTASPAPRRAREPAAILPTVRTPPYEPLEQRPSFGLYLSQIRHRRGLSQKALAVRAEVSVGYVGMIESGQRIPRDKVLNRLSAALQCDVHEINNLRWLGGFLPEQQHRKRRGPRL